MGTGPIAGLIALLLGTAVLMLFLPGNIGYALAFFLAMFAFGMAGGLVQDDVLRRKHEARDKDIMKRRQQRS